ncbi:regulator [Streptomyces sp. SID8379]|uniref:ATP-binding protein n=1 Tax=unclassified Streptomyces TaxID=2593676 RepID=UPI0003823E82|nr:MULTISPECIES: AAA family ATPase [unclassified Streptomyces]MYW65017.1 regulator [Streptomyces sp. SID8379]
MRRTPRPEDPCAGPPHPGNLPHELNRFLGRDAELAALRGIVESARLVTVTGIGGVGKSRFAAHAAAGTPRELCRDGVWRVELAAVRQPELVEYTLAETLGLTDHTARPSRQVLLDHLAERRLVLVLDGFEHLIDACASLVRDLLRTAPGLRVIAVGRRPLALDGERLFPLTPLAAADAAELLADRTAALLPDFALHDGNRADVLEVCRRLDCLPLAVELAAGRLRALSPAQLLERLDDRFRLLTGGGRDVLPRHQTLRTTIGWSHELCTAQERLLWARLSVFSGSFDLEAAEYICSGDGLHADAVLDVLHELLAQSVVFREDSSTGVRYRMLDTVRAYGAEWLDGIADTARMRRRHRDWYMGLATWCELDWFSPRQGEVAARIDAELPNLRAALEFCLTEPGETHLGQHLAGTLWFYWAGCGRLAEGRHWLRRSVELDAENPEGDEQYGASRLKVLWVLGYVAILQGDTVPALAALQECRDEAERTGNETALAYAVHRTGCLALVTDDMPRAEQLLRDALARYREIGELNSNVLMGQVELAMAAAFQGEMAQAVALCEDVRQVCEDHGERWTRAYALYVLAYAHWSGGELARARQLLGECLAIDHEFNDLLGTVLAVELLALVTAAEGDASEAAVLQGAAARIWLSVGLPLFGSAYYNVPHELCERRAREALGDARFAELARVGEQLGHDEVVARALGSDARARSATVPRPARAPAPETRKPAASPTANGGETTG